MERCNVCYIYGVLRQRVHPAREDDDGMLWVLLQEKPFEPALAADSSGGAQQIAQCDHFGVGDAERAGAHRRHLTGGGGERPMLAAVESDRYAYAQAHA